MPSCPYFIDIILSNNYKNNSITFNSIIPVIFNVLLQKDQKCLLLTNNLQNIVQFHAMAINYAKHTTISIIGIYPGSQNQGYIRRSTLKDANFLIAEPMEFNKVINKYSFHDLLHLSNFHQIIFYDTENQYDSRYHYRKRNGLDYLLNCGSCIKSNILTIHSMVNNNNFNQKRTELLLRMVQFIYNKITNYNPNHHRVIVVKFN